MAGKGSGMRKASLVLAGITCIVPGLAARPALAAATLPPGGHIVATIPDPADPAGVEAGFGSIWVANGPAGAIVRIDQVVATIQAGRPACCLAFGANAVWAASFATDALVRIDPAANVVADAFPSGGLGPEGIAFGDGYVCVANHHGDSTGSVAKIDPATDTVIDVIAVGAASPAGGPGFLAAVPGSVWAGAPMPSPRRSRCPARAGRSPPAPTRCGLWRHPAELPSRRVPRRSRHQPPGHSPGRGRTVIGQLHHGLAEIAQPGQKRSGVCTGDQPTRERNEQCLTTVQA
jgi:hypothetical protein